MASIRILAASLLALFGGAASAVQTAPEDHESAWSRMITEYGRTGAVTEEDRPPGYALDQSRRLTRALAALAPQRPGIVDAYVLSIGMNSDAVFGREAREAARVLARRYDAVGRSITLAFGTGANDDTLPNGSPVHLEAALARIAEVADPREDVLVLYATSHGHDGGGLIYADGERAIGAVGPDRLAALLRHYGFANRLLLISACYSGNFVPRLAAPGTAIMTAASATTTSFGCDPGNDWTYFGDALVNRALRKAQPLDRAMNEARTIVAGWEARDKLDPSRPQISIGNQTARWLKPLEARMPKSASQPTGRSPALAPASSPPAP